ncbi:16S rRNA (uracil(1498)-N(3))-methyltransferase [Anaeromyxobacter sp. Red801]|uniref:16S rRNA (uracil(1498)-N(3))-methyltransferase n=1 Tax=Anaeromyxobacter sp. Red801 TaxID=3411632 RepID=UPI003B9F4B97
MSLRRVHLPPERIGEGRAALTDEARHYLRDVLRLAPGAAVELFDGRGGAWEATVLDGFEALALGARRAAPGAGAPVWLLVALAKGEKVDLVVQKATELGAARIAPFAAERSVVRLEPEKGEARAARWRRIAGEAARQCGRADVPEVRAPAPLEAALAEVPAGFGAFVFHPGGAPLSEAAPSPAGGYAAVVGPEGGLTDAERAACARAGARATSLGPRVLRAETAAIVAVALLQARFGDLR